MYIYRCQIKSKLFLSYVKFLILDHVETRAIVAPANLGVFSTISQLFWPSYWVAQVARALGGQALKEFIQFD